MIAHLFPPPIPLGLRARLSPLLAERRPGVCHKLLACATLFSTLTDITERKTGEACIQILNNALNQRAVALKAANRELEAFNYSLWHDLRAPST